MSLLIREFGRNTLMSFARIKPNITTTSSLATSTEDYRDNPDSIEFRVLNLRPKKVEKQKRKMVLTPVPPPRADQMPVDQDWPSVWPGPKTFHPAAVPLPIRQGYPVRGQASPSKYANAELMKIPNFLHLTPPAIQRQCEALKQFCTEWPAALHNTAECDKHFPVTVITSDYCYSSPTIRDPLARVVTLKIKLSSLKLDTHARDKLLRLAKDRYDPQKDVLTIVADRCPTRKQNAEYVEYLLTALFHESWNKEAWEDEKSEADMEYYDWETGKSKETLITIHCWPEPPKDIDYTTIPNAEVYKAAVSDLINQGEDQYSVNKYKNAVKKLLKLKDDQ